MSVKLPPELIDLIIDHSYNDRQALSTFSLVGKGWVNSSRYHLFSTIKLDEKSVSPLMGLLDSPWSTVIPEYIRSIDIVFKDAEHQIPNLFSDIHIIARFPCIDSLAISFEERYYSVNRRRAILTLSFATLTYLELRRIVFDQFVEFVAFLCPFQSLRSVVMRVHWNVTKLPISNAYQPPQFLQSLDIDNGTDDMLEWLLNIQPMTPLSSVCLRDVILKEIPHIARYLSALGPSLKDLHVTFMDDEIDTFFNAVDLSVHTNLQSLKLEAYLEDMQSIFISAPHFLSQIESYDVEEITFSILSDDSIDVEKFPWSYIKQALARPQFQRLRCFRLHLRGHDLKWMHEDKIRIRNILSLHRGEDILRFETQLLEDCFF